MAKQIARTRLYYKFDIGACSNLGKTHFDRTGDIKNQLKELKFDDQEHAVYVTPLNIGVQVDFGVSLEAFVGAFYMLEYLPEELEHDFGVNAELGIWLAKFYAGVKLQRGFSERTVEGSETAESFLSNIMLRIGFSF